MGCGASAQSKYTSDDEKTKPPETNEKTTTSPRSPHDKEIKSPKSPKSPKEGPKITKTVSFSLEATKYIELDSRGLPPSKTVDRGNALDSASSVLVIGFLANVPLLQSLHEIHLPRLAQAMDATNYKVGDVVIAQGSMNNRLFIILSGKAEVVLHDGESEIKLVTLGAGDYFGEHELLHEDASRATVRVLEELVTYSITHDRFWELGLHKKLHIPKRRAMVSPWESGPGGDLQSVASLAGEKEDADTSFIITALRANAYIPSFCELTDELATELAAAARLRNVASGEVLMKQGDLHGSCFYIVQQGSFELHGHGRPHSVEAVAGDWEARAEPGDSFGELELLYALPCVATVTALADSTVWCIGSSDFTVALEHYLQARLDEYVEVLRAVKVFKGLFKEELQAIASTVTEATYKKGEAIIKQGELGDTLFVLVQGEVQVLIEGVEVETRLAIRSMKKAELFGEQELLHPRPRVATVQVTSKSATVLAVDKTSAELVLEPLEEVFHAVQAQGDARKQMFRKKRDAVNKCIKRWNTGELMPIRRKDLGLLGAIGSGAFSTVDLVQQLSTGKRFALRRVRRNALTEPRQRRQLLSMKTILFMINSPFVVRLHGTYRDAAALSFLFELVPGGDLYQAYCLHDLYGNVQHARFYTAGVTLALEHLHERCIVHRDVKLENILLDSKGWPKLTDFGIAKLCVEKTYTRCGTPNYVAPEVLTEVGHGTAVDWWSLGVVMYEMIAACTPFESPDGDFLKTCRLSLQGIPSREEWTWPKGFDEHVCSLIPCLLQPNPLRRLPMQLDGMSQFKAHPWFADFSWGDFEDRTMESPIIPAALDFQSLEKSEYEEEWRSAKASATDWDAGF